MNIRTCITILCAILGGVLLFNICTYIPSCKSPGLIDLSDQPCQDTVSPPVGKWTRTPTICVDDSIVYTPTGCTPNPALQPLCEGITEPAVRDFVAYVHGICPKVDARFVGDILYADIPVRLYDGPYGGCSDMDRDELLKWLILIGVMVIIDNADINGSTVGFDLTGTQDGTESALMNLLNNTPPPAEANYNGVCYFTRRGDRLTAASVWINVHVMGLPGWGRDVALTYIPNITRHELGHAIVGFNDNLPTPDPLATEPPMGTDLTPDAPGLMSYTGHVVNASGMWLLSDDEIVVMGWMYE